MQRCSSAGSRSAVCLVGLLLVDRSGNQRRGGNFGTRGGRCADVRALCVVLLMTMNSVMSVR